MFDHNSKNASDKLKITKDHIDIANLKGKYYNSDIIYFDVFTITSRWGLR